MILTIDVGNTFLTFGLFSNGKIRMVENIKTADLKKKFSLMQSLEIFKNKEKISHVIVCSVVDEIDKNICKVLSQAKLEFTFLNNIMISKLGIKTLIKGTIGTDRLVNIFMCLRIFDEPFLIIDLGTATTFDYVNESKIYEGGLIFPGIDVSLKSLHKYTSKLPIVKFKKNKKVVSNNTNDAISSGFYWGYLSMIQGLIVKIKSEKSTEPKVILTGGNCEYFRDFKIFDLIDKNLTIKSLYSIYKNIIKK
tara:strand:- start:1348 stop:2097 length:750 start_codon:yes stop_codon:yes gene_type:complete